MISRVYIRLKKRGKNAVVQTYLLEHELKKEELLRVAEALTNPILEEFSINELPSLGFNYAVEIGFKPGVTDNVAHTVKETILDLLGNPKLKIEVYSSRVFLVQSKDDFPAYNPLIERAHVVANKKKDKKFDLPLEIPKVVLDNDTPVINVSLISPAVPKEELEKIGKEGIMDPRGGRRGPLALDLASMETIQKHFQKLGRDPTDVELESLAQTWSEHCKHTIFASPIDEIKEGLYKTFIKGATNEIRRKKGKDDFCVSVFSDNAGGIIFDKDYLVTHKVETHNSPSALDPFGGAITGILGVNRDTIGFGLGSKPIANTYGFCFSSPDDNRIFFKDKNLTQTMLPSARIIEGVIKGINVGGNCSGIPTLNGFIKLDDRYRAKPMVFAGTVGLIPRKLASRLSHEKKARAGDYIVIVGGRVGLDGIHGATFSSVGIDTHSPATAVQIGDPITQKKLSDALVKEARSMDLYTSITDNGAGGLSCSVAEMGRESGGAEVNLEKVPLKYPGLEPWEIWISESQERMTLSVPPRKWEVFNKLMKSRGVEATVIGEFTDSGKIIVKYGKRTVMDLGMEFLDNGWPKRNLISTPVKNSYPNPKLPRGIVRTGKLLELLSRKNLAGFSFISEQYDHEVQASSVLKPLSGPGRINTDAQVFAPILNSKKGVVLSTGISPSYSDLDTYQMAAGAIDTAVRNAICAGATLKHLAILDNFCWCSSYDSKRLYELKQAVRACYDLAVSYGTPFISGKDSMFNDFNGYDQKGKPTKISIPLTLLISAIGVMKDIRKTISPEFKKAGDVIYLLGETHDEFGGSEYFRMLGGIGANAPIVNLERNFRVYQTLEKAIEKELLASAISVAAGGLGIALAKAILGGMLGVSINLQGLAGGSSGPDQKLFSESQGRVLVSISPKNVKQFEKLMSAKGGSASGGKKIPYTKLGRVSKSGKFVIMDGKRKLVETNVKALYKNYHKFSDQMRKDGI